MAILVVGGGIGDRVLKEAGAIMSFVANAKCTLHSAAVGGVQYLDVSSLSGTAFDGGTFPTDADGWIPPVQVTYDGDSPGGAWVECWDAWGTTRKWLAAHGVSGSTGGGPTGESALTVDTIEVRDHISLGGGLLLSWTGGAFKKSVDAGVTWTDVDTVGGGTGGTPYTPPAGMLRLIRSTDGVTELPADIGTDRILYTDSSVSATKPAWLRGEDIFLTKVTY